MKVEGCLKYRRYQLNDGGKSLEDRKKIKLYKFFRHIDMKKNQTYLCKFFLV